MSYTSITHVSTEHKDWLRALDFYHTEIHILENRLLEVIKKNNRPEALKGIEHFQNQFLIQRNNIDELRHKIKENEHYIFTELQKSSATVSYPLIEDHSNLREEFMSFERIILELRHEYNLFLANWM